MLQAIGDWFQVDFDDSVNKAFTASFEQNIDS